MADERAGELTTANYGWIKPNVGNSDDAWGGYLNTDLDGIDSVVHGIQISIPTVPGASVTAPAMDGTAAAGSSAQWSRGDHVHPHDTTKYDTTNPAGYQTAANVTATLAPYALTSNVPIASSTTPIMDGAATVGTGATWARADHVHPTDTTRYAASNPAGYITAAAIPAPYVLPTASTSILGGVKVDGSTIAINSGVISAGGASITVSDTPPSTPSAGALWFNSSSGAGGGQLYVWYTDPNTSQWVPTTNQMGGGYLPKAGVTDGTDAPPGQIGEVISSVVALPGVTLTTSTPINVASISLTAGDWDVQGDVWIGFGTGGGILAVAAINNVSATLPVGPAINAVRFQQGVAFTASAAFYPSLRPCRVSLAATTTYYLIAFASFPSGTSTAAGAIWARRVR